MSTMFDLIGTTAVVTGAGRGIGFAMAEALARAGADIIGVSATLPPTGARSATRSRRTAALRGAGGGLRGPRRGRSRSARSFAERAPDILVNNAGTIERAPAVDHPLDLWDRVLEINLTSQFVLTQLVARPMLERGRGKIIFTASLLSFQGGITVPGYTASKSGIAGLTKALANEWAARGVNVNAIAPGYIATDNTAALQGDPNRARSILERIPAGRWGEASRPRLARPSSSPPAASDYVHGIVLPVDGGWLGR